MKKIILALFAVLLTTSIALAAWQDTFLTDFAKNGAATVATPLALGVSPSEIIDVATAAGVDPTMLVTAMCEAGSSPQDLQKFLAKLGNMSPNVLMTICLGPENISQINKFPGATLDSSSVSKVINYDGDGAPLGSAGGAGVAAGVVGGGATPIPPASGSRP